MTGILDMMSPDYIRDDRLVLQVAQTSGLIALQPITVEFDYSAADPAGVQLPLMLTVAPGYGAGGEGSGWREKIFRRAVPTSYTFTVPGAGSYLLTLRELSHNRWWGRLVIEVAGDEFSRVPTTGRR